MKNKFYMQEFQFFDGESIIRFNIVDLNEDKQEIYVAITRQGKISVVTYPLLHNENGWYFEYGPSYEKIQIVCYCAFAYINACRMCKEYGK